MEILIQSFNVLFEFDNSIEIINGKEFVPLYNINTINNANENSFVFIDKASKSKEELIKNTKAKVVVCDIIPNEKNYYEGKCLIISSNPKLFFARFVNQFLKQDRLFTIHPSATIHPEAIIADNCQIGANTYIGKCQIGEGSIINSNCSIYDKVKIGKNVIIDSGVVIGAAGFGFVRDEEGVPHRFPQLGRVIIEDDVEIGANTCIDRGALSDTIIHKGVKIDNLVQIAHNVEIGQYTYIISNCVIAGSTKIGEKCWIAPSFIMNKVTIGDNVTVGFGSVVLKNLKDDSVVMGNPAIYLDKYAKLQYNLKKMYYGNQ